MFDLNNHSSFDNLRTRWLNIITNNITLPNSLFLIPGYGAQGATARDALSGLIKRNQVYEGGLINSSRKILFPEGSYNVGNIKNWKQLIKASLENTLNDLKG